MSLAAAILPLAFGCRASRPSATSASLGGWEALGLRNGVAEVLVVPAVGRIMAFRLLEGASEGMGPFWRHPAFGPGLGPDENGWTNHGGDKAWPAPQADWPARTGEGWPPPRTFDAVSHAVSVEPGAIVLVSPVDPHYGARVRRRISLDPARPILTVDTIFEKVAGRPLPIAVWTITQLTSPERLYVRLPSPSAFAMGHENRLPAAPAGLRVANGLLSLTRDPAEKTMLGSDGDALVWVGKQVALLIESETAATSVPGAWPDGFHSQIYTSPDASHPYVELELLERVRPLGPGEAATLRARYVLAARTTPDPDREAHRIAVERTWER